MLLESKGLHGRNSGERSAGDGDVQQIGAWILQRDPDGYPHAIDGRAVSNQSIFGTSAIRMQRVFLLSP